MAPTDLADEPALLAHLDDLVDGGRGFTTVAVRLDLPGGGRDPDGGPCAVAAERLRGAVRGADLVAEVDRCTFVVVAPDLTPAGAAAVVERVRRAFALPVEVDGELVAVPAGVAAVATPARRPSSPPLVDRRSAVPEAGVDPVVVPAPADGRDVLDELQRQLGA